MNLKHLVLLMILLCAVITISGCAPPLSPIVFHKGDDLSGLTDDTKQRLLALNETLYSRIPHD